MERRPLIRIEQVTFDMPALRRLAIWGLATAGALAIAVAAAFSDAGSRRLMASAPASNAGGAAQKASPPAAPAPDRDAESRRLSEVLGALVADREQLVARIGAIERNLEDVTGSLQRQAAAAAAVPSPPAPASPATGVPAAPPPSREAALPPPTEPSKSRPPGPCPRCAGSSGRRGPGRAGGAAGCAVHRKFGRARHRARRRRRRSGQFRRPASALGLDQRQQCNAVRRPPPGGGDARKFADQGGRATAHRRPAGNHGGGGTHLRDADGRAPLLPAGRIRGPPSGPRRHRAGAQTCCRAQSGAGCVAEIGVAVALSTFKPTVLSRFRCRILRRTTGSYFS
jgi:hypothetical protein